MKRTLVALAIVLALGSLRGALAQEDAPFDVWLVVPAPLPAEVAEAVGRCLAQAVRDVPPRDRAAEDFQVGEVLLPRNVGERITIKGDATPWKKSPASGGGKVLEVADRGVLAEVRGGATWLEFAQVVRLEEVTDQLTAALRDKPGDGTLLLTRACLNGMGERLDEAIADLDIILRDEPRRIHCLPLRAVLHSKVDRDEAALADWTRVIELGQQQEYALRSRALALLALGREDEALADYERLLKLEPADITFYMEFAALRAKQGNSDTVRELLRQATEIETDDVSELVELARLMDDLEVGESAGVYRRATTMLASTPQQFASRALAHAMLDDVDTAYADFARALELNPRSRGDRGEWRQRLDDLNKALALNPENTGLLLLRCGVCWELKEYEKAIADLTAVLRLNPRPLAYGLRGDLYLIKGQYDAAIEDYTAALKIDARCVDAYKGRGRTYMLKRDWAKAIADLDQVRAIKPAERETLEMWRACWMSREDWEQAVAELRQRSEAAAEAKEAAQALTARGLILWKNGQEADASEDFAAALRADPKCHDATVYQAWLRVASSDSAVRDPAAALTSLLDVITADDLDLSKVRSVVQVFAAKGEYERAMRVQLAVLELRPGDEKFQAEERALLENLRARWKSERAQAKPLKPLFPGLAPASQRFGSTDSDGTPDQQRR